MKQPVSTSLTWMVGGGGVAVAEARPESAQRSESGDWMGGRPPDMFSSFQGSRRETTHVGHKRQVARERGLLGLTRECVTLGKSLNFLAS